MGKRLLCAGILILASLSLAFGGDVAQFVNLGFSADGRYFEFGEYGIMQDSSLPYADLFFVDVPKNDFVPQGVNRFTGTKAVEPGYTGLGALLNLTSAAAAMRKQFGVDHLITGRFLYILLDGAPANDSMEFRDFPMGRKYTVQLLQSSTVKGSVASSSFHIAVTIEEKDGRVHRLTVGNPQTQRAGVKAYHIKQIVLSPDGKSHVFVIQKEETDGKGDNVRYMVETVRIP